MAQQPLQVGARLDSYIITGVLGTGGFGVTYDAVDADLDRRVAIKEYFPEALATRDSDRTTVRARTDGDASSYAWGLGRFLDEARTLARFHSPHIVHVNRYLESNHTAYLVMDYEDGRPLVDYLDDNAALGEQAVREVLVSALLGLGDVHRERFLHRDVKPSNIFVRRSGPPLLIDFGSARMALQHRARQAMTVILTPGYAPLEQYGEFADSDDAQGPWTDIYALGATAYHCLTGRVPPDAVARMRATHAGRVDPARDGLAQAGVRCQAALVDLVVWMLEPHAEQRPRSCAEVLQRLAQLAAAKADGAPPWPTLEPDPGATQRARSRSDLPTLEQGPLHPRLATPPPPPAAGTQAVAADARAARNEQVTEFNPPAPAVTEADLTRAREVLAEHLGPIARVLVRRAASRAANRAELVRLLAAEIDDAAERVRFETALGRLH